jgi:outer membrane lipoprotein carrier protein
VNRRSLNFSFVFQHPAALCDKIGVQPMIINYPVKFKKVLFAAVLFVFGMLQGTTSQAGTGNDRLQHFFDHLNGLKADFTQTVIDAHSVTIQNASGTLELLRPGRFRWDYAKPYQQLIVADGKKISIYDPDLDQVTVKLQDQTIGNMPALLLSNNQPLEDSFNITDLGEKDGLAWLELDPKARDTSFEKIRLAFNDRTLHTMELVDSFGQTTQLVFSNLQRNPDIDPAIFHFTPPPGVDVIGDVDE